MKGLSHEMDLSFEDMHGHWSVLGLNRGLGQFLNFLGAPKKILYLAVAASLI
jgi:hypothetical protein